jgi:hypothetical protein
MCYLGFVFFPFLLFLKKITLKPSFPEMNLISIATAAVLVLASFNEAAPAAHHQPTKGHQISGLNKIKHVVYFMQVCIVITM